MCEARVYGAWLTTISQLTGLSLRISVGTAPPMGSMAAGTKPVKLTVPQSIPHYEAWVPCTGARASWKLHTHWKIVLAAAANRAWILPVRPRW